jgi:hypothetical protein
VCSSDLPAIEHRTHGFSVPSDPLKQPKTGKFKTLTTIKRYCQVWLSNFGHFYT